MMSVPAGFVKRMRPAEARRFRRRQSEQMDLVIQEEVAGEKDRHHLASKYTMTAGARRIFLLLLLFVFSASSVVCLAQKPGSSLLVKQGFTDGDLLVSWPKGTFVMGFFSPTGTSVRYLGIWYQYMQPQTVVWVANRGKPITGLNGSLNITSTSIDVYSNSTVLVWSSGTLPAAVALAQCTLYDNGNFIAADSSNSTLWQTFDQLSDTLLPGMRIGYTLSSVLYMISWKTPSDPSFGSYSNRMDPNRMAELVLFSNGTATTLFRSGPWNGTYFDGIRNARTTPSVKYNLSYSNTAAGSSSLYWYDVADGANKLWRLVVSSDGVIYRYYSQGSSWVEFYRKPQYVCDNYAFCGPNGVCVDVCICLDGFVPANETQWGLHQYSGGCVRAEPLNCNNTAPQFISLQSMKLPDTQSTSIRTFASFNSSQCRQWCASNCSCMAYTMTFFGGCTTWRGDLMDMQQFPENYGDRLFIKVAQAPSNAPIPSPPSLSANVAIYTGAAAGGVVLILVAAGILFFVVRLKQRRATEGSGSYLSEKLQASVRDLRGVIFELSVLDDATDGFADANLLGRGLFGRVYKGTFKDGREIAVKRLSPGCPQGLEQLSSEISSLANLSHRNLVKLLGFYIGEDEKLLCYEFMPNGSLDQRLFAAKDVEFSWPTRVRIIRGIADGLLYLHEEAPIAVIHRDIKPSNILLDEDLTPKIGDFGLSRLFDSEQTTVETMNIMGTIGYMAPELHQGRFSTRSDVYSFGIVILEMIAGQRNCPSYSNSSSIPDLLSYVREQWSTGSDLNELKDPRIGEVFSGELLHFIHIALLCTQEVPASRPSMRQVIVMLSSDSVVLPMVLSSPASAFIDSGRIQAR